MITISGVIGPQINMERTDKGLIRPYPSCDLSNLWLWFDQAVVAVVSFVDHSEARGVGVAKYQELIRLT